MINKIKKSLILLSVFISAFGINSKASSFDEDSTFKKTNTILFNQNGNVGLNRPNVNDSKTIEAFKDEMYEMTNDDGEEYAAYCMDPHWDAGTNYTVDRILGTDSKSDKTKAYDLALLEIMKTGYNQDNNEFNGLSGDNLYIATSIASRALTMGIFNYGKTVGTPNYNLKVARASMYISRAASWASEFSEYANEIMEIDCKNTKKYNTCYTKNYINKNELNRWYNSAYDITATDNSEGEKILETAKKLFEIGLKKAVDVLDGEDETASVSTSSVSKDDEYYYYTISFENFDAKKGEIGDFTLSCTNCKKNNISLGDIEFYNPEEEEYEEYKKGNVLDKFDDDEKTISGKIKIRFKVTNDGTDCKSVKYTISYKYNDPSVEYIGALLKSTTTQQQRFFVVQKNEGGLENTITGSVSCSNSCETNVSLPVCSTDEDEATAKIEGPEDIKTCVIDNEDDAGNSYQYTASAGGVDNDYCKVYCKEDYSEIRLNPVIEDVKCGGYFSLKSYIKGTKICYTGGDTTDKSIDKAQYFSDIAKAQEDMVEAYNEYYKWSEALDNIKLDSGKYYCKRLKIETNHDGKTVETCVDDGHKNGYSVDIRVNLISISCDKNTGLCTLGTKSEKVKYDKDGGSDGGCGNRSCKSGKKDTIRENIQNLIDEAEDDLDDAIAKYNEIISDYNACTTAWTNSFAFAQKIKYYYDENRGENGKNFTTYYDLINSINDEEMFYLEADDDATEDGTVTVCLGKTDNKYECLNPNETKTFDISVDNDTTNNYNYNSAYSDIFSEQHYIVCSKKECKTDTKWISNATFVKKEVTKEKNYSTKTTFEQIAANGKITVIGANDSDKLQLEKLYNKLPVSTSSVGGGVFKLMIEGLGEFYSETSEYGRLIDYNQKNETKSVAYARGVDVFNGEYVCYYKNLCRPKDCPNCEFTCEGEYCEWKECPTCNLTCVNCLFDLSNLNIVTKTITTTNVLSASRTYGYNWITTSSIDALKLLSQKADKTISEIQEINEMVYDDKTTDGSTLGFSIKLTPEVISKIKEYNKNKEDEGGYINDSLTCYDATISGQTYKNIYCYSELIDELLDENSENVTVLSSRINDENQRASGTQNSGYWSLWSNFSVDKTSESVIGGPSWK